MDFEADAEKQAAEIPRDELLQSISTLAKDQLELEDYISYLEDELTTAKQKYRELTEITLPEKMQQIGVSEFKLSDGTKVTVKQFVEAHITDEHKDEAFTWLRSNDHGDLIKNEFKVNFGKGDDAMASRLKEYLQHSLKWDYSEKTFVHPMTLKAFVREQVETGQAEFPLEIFGVHIGNRTKITLPKGRK